ncbi:hypothetical protein N9C06_00670 [Salibacteraceae bacterium]|jgi:Tfp pilus assembly pilus retraction ATPase PilT|nr:hypothetical protein [Salibacteraceae bacterium]
MKNNLDDSLENKIRLSLKKEASDVQIRASIKENLLQKLEKDAPKRGKVMSFVWSKNPIVRLGLAASLAAILFSVSVNENRDSKRFGFIEALADSTLVFEDTLNTKHDSIIGISDPWAL